MSQLNRMRVLDQQFKEKNAVSNRREFVSAETPTQVK